MKILTVVLFLLVGPIAAAAGCGPSGVWLQVLGSGGPELDDGRASTSYLIWVDGKARVMIDAGGGSAYQFERAAAQFSDLRVILLSHLHVDHTADLPVYVKGSFFTQRASDLPIYGPSGNRLMPDVDTFVTTLFGSEGAFRYLSDYLDPGRPEGYRLEAHPLDAERQEEQQGYRDKAIETSAIAVHHGPIPALAWKVSVAGKTVVFSGDMNGDFDTLPKLAKQADLLVAHNAVPESARGVARRLHMPPSVIGRIAAQADVKQLLLSHRMRRTLGREVETERLIRQHFHGSVQFADDLDCFQP